MTSDTLLVVGPTWGNGRLSQKRKTQTTNNRDHTHAHLHTYTHAHLCQINHTTFRGCLWKLDGTVSEKVEAAMGSDLVQTVGSCGSMETVPGDLTPGMSTLIPPVGLSTCIPVPLFKSDLT